MQGLTPGRMVHYVVDHIDETRGEHRPAVVVKVLDTDGLINLTAFPDLSDIGAELFVPTWFLEDIPYDEAGAPGTWHWIERED